MITKFLYEYIKTLIEQFDEFFCLLVAEFFVIDW